MNQTSTKASSVLKDFKYDVYRMHILNDKRSSFRLQRLQEFQMEEEGISRRWSLQLPSQSFSTEVLYKDSDIFHQLIELKYILIILYDKKKKKKVSKESFFP